MVFGILLEVSKTCEKGLKEGIREALRSEEGVLLGLLGSDLEGVAGASLEASKTIVSHLHFLAFAPRRY